MNRYPRRLIEVDLPIKRISAHARREKSIRHGHISTLHIWWARRPLASCRAVILASMWPDPAPGPDDPPCPPAFVDAARTWMTDWATKHAEKASKESFPRLKTIQDKPAILIEQPLELRNALLDFIADFANWDNSTDKDYLETSRALVQAAHEALGGAPGTRPLVVDPFAGGGSIPLEALRVGADAFASDLNPVAVLLNKVVLEYIPKYASTEFVVKDAEGNDKVLRGLGEAVRHWGTWIKQEAEKELAEFYPKDRDGATPIAYLWARTIQCEGPGCGAEVPLIRSLWLAKKANRSVALRLVPNHNAKRVDFKIIVKQRGCWVEQDNPKEGIAEPTFDGTVRGGTATCPCCGHTTPTSHLRRQLSVARGGAATARLTAVATLKPGEPGRSYRPPMTQDTNAAKAAGHHVAEMLRRPDTVSPVPDELISRDRPSPNARGLSAVTRMGVERFGDLFTPRQQLALATLSLLVKRVVGGSLSEEATAIRTVLALSVGKVADLANSCCRWEPVAECPRQLFARQAVPIVWDFPEGVPTGKSSGSWDIMIDRFVQLLRTGGSDWNSSEPQIGCATNHPLPDDTGTLLFTDPPYYDAVPYADLSDFFYVWLRRSLFEDYPHWFAAPLVEKDDEAIWNPSRIHSKTGKIKDERFYELQMQRALVEGRRVTDPSALGVVVFAHKSTAGWEAILSALLAAGWITTASWPVDTEMGSRVNAMGTASLASSVHIVCRPRDNADGSVRTDDVGDWRDVLAELPTRIHDWMPRLAAEGVVGADAIFACLGPALEIFSRYSRVEKASGEAVTLKEYLEQVWAVVSTEALSMIFDDADAAGLEPDARLTAMWLWTLGAAKSQTGGAAGDSGNDEEADDDGEENASKKKPAVAGFALEFDAARKIAQGLGIHLDRSPSIVEVKGDTARLLPVVERTPYLFGKDAPGGTAPAKPRRNKQRKLFDELEAVETSVGGSGLGASLSSRPTPGKTVLDRVHQAMVLFAVNRGEALKQFLVDDGVGRDGRFWKLAQSLSALYPVSAEEKRWVDGVLARKKGLGL